MDSTQQISKLHQVLQELRNKAKVAIYVVDCDAVNPTALLSEFISTYPQFDELLKPIVSQPSNQFNGYVRIICQYQVSMVSVKVVIPDSLTNSEKITYYKTMSLETCETLFNLIAPLSKFMTAKELIEMKYWKYRY